MLLSIAIPTYNGSATITETLSSILSQTTEEIKKSIEIVISDNSDNDFTKELIGKINLQSNTNIKYHKNEHNIGYDRNVDNLFKLSSGKYVWPIADDDVPCEHAIKSILNILNEDPSIKVMLINFNAYNSKLSAVVDKLEIKKNGGFDRAEDFLNYAELKYSLLSSLIIRRTSWHEANPENGFGSNFVHVYALYKILLTGRSFILENPLIKYRQGSTNFGTSPDATILTALSFCKLTLSMKGMGYPEWIVKKLLDKSRRYVYSMIKNGARSGISEKKTIITSLLSVYRSPKVWIRLIPAILFSRKPKFSYPHTSGE